MALVSDETQRLRRTLRDLVALSALSAVWVDQAPARIAEELAEALVRVLGLEFRSEERRVGKECRSRWSPYH